MTDARLSIPRRAFLLWGLAGAAATGLGGSSALAAPTAPAGGRLAFHVYRKGAKIGEHMLEFSSQADSVTMRAQVEMAVNLGPVPVFRYRHSQVERWAAGRFDLLETHTTQNGSRFQIEAQRTPGGVELDGAKGGRKMLAAAALPLTHWNRGSLDGPLFNPQDGKMMRLSVATRGPAQVLLANGQTVSAQRVALAGETTIEDFYDPIGAWTGLKAKAKDGSLIEYRRA